VDYSRQQNSKEQKEAVRRQEQYWLEQFEKETPKLNLPTDFPRPPIRKFSGSNVDFRIQPEETKRVKELAAQEDVTLYMFLLAVFNVFLFKITGQEDILVGTPAANRRHTDLENIIGMFANIIVMRNSPARQRSFRSFLKEIRQRTLQAFDNQDYKLEDLVEQVVKEKDLSRHPLFDVLFSLQNMEFPRIRFSDLSMEQLEQTLWAARTDLVFVAFELPGSPEIGVLVEYNTPLFKAETIRGFIADFKTVLAAILADPDTRLQDIEIAAPHIGHAETGAARLRELDLGF
jgi:non-ribosomal peptide synthetase component F